MIHPQVGQGPTPRPDPGPFGREYGGFSELNPYLRALGTEPDDVAILETSPLNADSVDERPIPTVLVDDVQSVGLLLKDGMEVRDDPVGRRVEADVA